MSHWVTGNLFQLYYKCTFDFWGFLSLYPALDSNSSQDIFKPGLRSLAKGLRPGSMGIFRTFDSFPKTTRAPAKSESYELHPVIVQHKLTQQIVKPNEQKQPTDILRCLQGGQAGERTVMWKFVLSWMWTGQEVPSHHKKSLDTDEESSQVHKKLLDWTFPARHVGYGISWSFFGPKSLPAVEYRKLICSPIGLTHIANTVCTLNLDKKKSYDFTYMNTPLVVLTFYHQDLLHFIKSLNQHYFILILLPYYLTKNKVRMRFSKIKAFLNIRKVCDAPKDTQ